MNFRNGGAAGLVLENVQVLSWVGRFLYENDRHLAIYGDDPRSTDFKVSGVRRQPHPCVPDPPHGERGAHAPLEFIAYGPVSSNWKMTWRSE